MPNFSTIIGYLSGLYFIDPELEASSLIPTLIAVHFFDGILCFLIAGHSGRDEKTWTLVGSSHRRLGCSPAPLVARQERQQVIGIRDAGATDIMQRPLPDAC